MSDKRKVFVVDTNIVVDYPGIIPGCDIEQPEEATVDLSHAHIVIPTVVIRELSKFKKEKNSDRGKVARMVLKRIRDIKESSLNSIKDNYELKAEYQVEGSDQTFSLLPVHKRFKKTPALQFCPSEDDMDGQIILAALSAIFLENGWSIDGTQDEIVSSSMLESGVTLLTNDNGLAIRARERGIKTESYGYKHPEPYTGRRDLVVPKEMFRKFLNFGRIELADWEANMPDQPELITNEFIVMRLEDKWDYEKGYDPERDYLFTYIGRYDVEEQAIVALQYANKSPVRLHNAGQAIYNEALMDERFSAVVCRGPAGCGKTYMSTVYGYLACKAGSYISVTVVPCDAQSNLGALPGDLDEKMDPNVQPLKNALRNYLLNEKDYAKKKLENQQNFGADSDKKPRKKNNGRGGEQPSDGERLKNWLKDQVDLIWDRWFDNVPIEHARGRDFSHDLAIYDEFQDQSVSQADTLIKRLGDKGKIIITGDVEQIHAPYVDSFNNGLVYASELLKDYKEVAQVCFTEGEVIRHPLVKKLVTRQKARRARKAD